MRPQTQKCSLRRRAANAVAHIANENDKRSANAAGGPADDNETVLAMFEQRVDAN